MRTYQPTVLLLFIVTINSYSQDIQFSQFYSNVLYINPAFAGSAHATRVILHNRLQWPGLNAKYITSSFTADHYFEKVNSGVGLLVLRDIEGSSILSSTQVALQYSYELHLSSKYSFRAGMQAGITSQYINYSKLTFPDQYSIDGYQGGATGEPAQGNTKTFFDLSSGGVFYSDRFWLSVAYDHMNQPNEAFYGTDVMRLPFKMDYATGYKFYLRKLPVYDGDNDTPYITPTAHYKFQGKSQQLDLGVYGSYERIILGLWYRGIPLVNDYRPGLQNNESIVVQVGYKVLPSLSISYSYDAVVSVLANAHTGGAHELNLTYIHRRNPKKIKIMKRIPCPTFYK